ncbi:hypothetical protein RHMOL_Rhmol10G0055400 [Rhododendron molle]|uniref:Uncharacterized protein n=1 Tax=Rhododendron molle TaxID=49168 RepID=A0ACC0M092_RHOML|nr:hypothetical protein RHMOL_Rhmol10G0055400 [Rhododendron molle]
MVLGSGVRSTVLRISEPSDRVSNGSDLISAINGSRLLVAEMRFEPSDAKSDGSEMRSTVLCTSLHSTNSKSKLYRGFIAMSLVRSN